MGERNKCMASSVAEDGTIYTILYYGDEMLKFVAVTPEGAVKWDHVPAGYARGTYHPPTIGPDGTIYFLTYSTELHNMTAQLVALNPEDGSGADYDGLCAGGACGGNSFTRSRATPSPGFADLSPRGERGRRQLSANSVQQREARVGGVERRDVRHSRHRDHTPGHPKTLPLH
jgi:hypothetical protein